MKKSIVITVHLQQLHQLLLTTTFGFYPHHKLTPEAEEFLVEEASATNSNGAIKIELYLPANSIEQNDEIVSAIHQHFAYSKLKTQEKLHHTIQLGWRALLIAMVFLAVLISTTVIVSRFLPAGGVAFTVREILIILGWVALWRPADLLLYEWRPIKREVNLYQRLQECTVEIIVENG